MTVLTSSPVHVNARSLNGSPKKKVAKKTKKAAKKKASSVRRFKVTNEGTLNAAFEAKTNAAWLKKLFSWEPSMLSFDQKDSIEKSKSLPLIIPFTQFLTSLQQDPERRLDALAVLVDEVVAEKLRDWYNNIFKAHLTDIVENNKPFEFAYLAAALNSRSTATAEVLKNINNLVEFGDEPPGNATLTDFPVMLLGSETPQPVKFISAEMEYGFLSGPKVSCRIQTYRWVNEALRTVTSTTKIAGWTGRRTLSEVGVKFSLDSKDYVEAAEKGKKAVRLNQEPAYVVCKDYMEIKTMWAWRRVSAQGRAMIDQEGMKLIDAEQARAIVEYGEHIDMSAKLDPASLSDLEFALVDQWAYGFSLVTKLWGRFHMDSVESISFREDAFDQLVIDEEDKKLILSLVKHVDPSKTTDFIEGKGGGCTFLFHGKPGLGKTLTAEAVAETVKRPLYAASVGELGTDVAGLEYQLNQVLQLAARWNAVLLLDEADVFLEERTQGDIERNAMVGTFLRLLEYYNGILILTSNRVKAIDPAFYSRISFARKYKEHDAHTRHEIVSNLLKINEISLTPGELAKISAFDVNGRQLKNSIRLARFLAEAENRPVRGTDIEAIILRVKSFAAELEEEARVDKLLGNG